MSPQILVTVATLFISSKAVCTLLESGNTAYIDTESENAITTMCQDPSSFSPWEQYQCEYIQNRDGYQKCWPQRRMSTCAPGTLKGAVFLYHGYSACPDQYNDIAPKLQADCWNVYQILTLGHGYDSCDNNGTDCAGEMYNVSFMPTQRQPYIDYVETMIVAIEEEVSVIQECEVQANNSYDINNLEVAVGGLSFGAPLAAATVIMSGVGSVFTKHVLMSPFFGISYKGIDDTIYKCLLNTEEFEDCLSIYFQQIGFDINEDESFDLTDMVIDALAYYVDVDVLDTSFETFNLMIRRIIEWIVEDPSAITQHMTQINTVLDSVIGWGDQCELDVTDENRTRGGFCQFKVRHLAAAHSFGSYVVDLLRDTDTYDTNVELLMILVERDGPTRNSLPFNYAHLYYNNDESLMNSAATDCMWLIDASCQQSGYTGAIDNNCGVPHSSMSRADNEGISPHVLWWEETYHSGLMDWLNSDNSETVYQSSDFMVKTVWDTTKDQCVYLDLMDAPSVLVADVPQLVTVGFRIIGAQVSQTIQDSILNGISEQIGVPRGVLELSVGIISANFKNGNIDGSDNDYVELEMNLDKDSAIILETMLQSSVESIADYGGEIVEYINLKGSEYLLTQSPTNIPTNAPITITMAPSQSPVKESGIDTTSTTMDTTENRENEAKTKEKKSNTSWAVLLVVLILLLAVIGGIYYLKRKNTKSVEQNQETVGMVKMSSEEQETANDEEQAKIVSKTEETPKETTEAQETNDKTEQSAEESSSEQSFILAGKPTKR